MIHRSLGFHLFDLVNFWYGLKNYEIEVISARKYENNAYDNAILKLVGYPEVVLEVSLLSWKNSFRAEFIGSNGSIHLDILPF
jgi:predicted dehydrogenase